MSDVNFGGQVKRTLMRGYGEGSLVFYFRDGRAVGLDLYREWRALGMGPLEQGVEIDDPLEGGVEL